MYKLVQDSLLVKEEHNKVEQLIVEKEKQLNDLIETSNRYKKVNSDIVKQLVARLNLTPSQCYKKLLLVNNTLYQILLYKDTGYFYIEKVETININEEINNSTRS